MRWGQKIYTWGVVGMVEGCWNVGEGVESEEVEEGRVLVFRVFILLL